MNHPLSAGFARRLVCWAATADAPGVLLARAACLSPQITRSISVYQIKFNDHFVRLPVDYAIDR
jgi:hypothetical protein